MASSDFSTYLVRDERLNDITSKLDVRVQQGASRSTYQQYSSNSNSNSALSFNVQPPSESIVMDRHVLLHTTVGFQLDISNVTAGKDAFGYGKYSSLQAFPLNSLFTTSTCTINNTATSVNTRDVIAPLLNLMDTRDLAKCNGMTPYTIDRHHDFTNSVQGGNANARNNEMSDYEEGGLNNLWIGRGAHPLTSVEILHKINGVDTDGSVISTDVNDTWVIKCTVELTEPLLMSPFLFTANHNQAGLAGINAINFVFTVDTEMRRFWSQNIASSANYKVTFQDDGFRDPKLLFNFLSSNSLNLIPARSVVPFIDLPRYITNQNNTGVIKSHKSGAISINNIQWNQIPDKIIIVCRKRLSATGSADANSFLSINKISINWNNNSGLLASASRNDLYKMSKKNGSKQSYYEFLGQANLYGLNTIIDPPLPGVGVVDPKLVYTTGSILVIDPARDLSLDSYLSNGSIGQFQLQFDIDVTNNGVVDVNPEIMVIAMNSGLFSTVAGSSVIQTGLLTKELVVSTATEQRSEAVSQSRVTEMSGSGFSDQISSALKCLPMLKPFMKGKAYSAGASSGGAVSGGALPINRLDSLVM